MRRRFRRRRHHAVHAVTADAMARCALELAGDVTTFATDILMRTVERETGGVVIEIRHGSKHIAAQRQ